MLQHVRPEVAKRDARLARRRGRRIQARGRREPELRLGARDHAGDLLQPSLTALLVDVSNARDRRTQEIDGGAGDHAALEQSHGEGRELTVVDKIVRREAPVAAAGAVARRLRRFTAVAEFLDQEPSRIVDEGLGFLGTDVGKVVVLDLAQSAAEPRVGFAGIGMDAIDDDLLAVAEEFEYLAVFNWRVRIAQQAEDLGEGLDCLEGNAALRRVAEANEDTAFVLETIAHEAFDRRRRVGIEDVDVERWREPRQDAGILRGRVHPAPGLDLVFGGVVTLLPSLDDWRLAVKWQRGEAAAKQLTAHLGGRLRGGHAAASALICRAPRAGPPSTDSCGTSR